ncbi:hypothetical protein G7Z17_g5784 [Cylindrodendrum hubeiense]|uniref:Uncharacterized protein n=1 Tax=Cylindrodendrum hubeiense TaxID=595255 RepID=A0A9P5H8E4_9HYPO|nr:hypothetical protein G7Z17_g5784 [Cylindrodendrum hubeiense]
MIASALIRVVEFICSVLTAGARVTALRNKHFDLATSIQYVENTLNTQVTLDGYDFRFAVDENLWQLNQSAIVDCNAIYDKVGTFVNKFHDGTKSMSVWQSTHVGFHLLRHGLDIATFHENMQQSKSNMFSTMCICTN